MQKDMISRQILEEAIFAVADGYCKINLSRNIVPGNMYQVLEGKKYNLNEQLGMPENSRFSDLVSAWSSTVPAESVQEFLELFDRDRLLTCFNNGETNITFNYWTRTAAYEPMFAENHIAMFREDETGDILAINYVIDRTEQYQLKRHIAMTEAISGMYDEMYYIELGKNFIKSISATDPVQEEEKGTDAKKRFKRFIESEVEVSYRSIMRIFMDFDSIGTRLGGKSSISQEFVNTKNEWIQCSFVPVERFESGEPSSILCIMRQITGDKEKFTMQDSIIRTLVVPYENAYVVDIHTGKTICYSMGQAMLERYGEDFFSGNYEKKISYYIENDVLKEDRKLFDQIRFLKNIENLLAERNNYCLNYRVFRNNEIKYYQCHLARLNKECNQFIVAFKSIDEEKKQELEQQNRLNIALEEGKRANKALREEMVISKALSQEYHSLLKLDAKTGEMSLYRTDGFGMKKEMLQELLRSHDYAGQILDKYIDNFVVKEDRERVRNATRLEVLKQNVPDQGLYKVSYLRILDNKYAYYEMNTIKIKENFGKVFFVIGMRDIDEKVRMQMKQDKEMEMQREIITALGYDYFSVLLVEPEKDHVTIFRQRSLNGKSIADLCAKYHNCWSEFIPNYARERVSDASYDEFMEKLSLDYIQSAKESYISIYEYVSDDGIVYYQIKVAFVQKQDGHRVAVISTKNIDEIIRKEKQQEETLNKALIEAKIASKAKTDFLFNMSHDIRTPMNAIIGFTNLLEKHLDDKETLLNYIGKIKTSNEFLLSLINNVLEMAKIENGKEYLDESVTNMEDFYQSVITLFDAQMKAKGVIFSYSVKIKHINIMIDATKMREILLNILSNALKYTPTGNSVTMTVTELPSEREDYAIYQMVIKDTGIGMSEEFLSHMFEYFSRERTTTESGVSGTGLGTAIVKKLVDLMHGTIDVESRLGKGTKITIKMSHQITDDQDIQQKIKNEQEYNPEDFTGKRILLAEDNDLNAEIAMAILEEQGIEVERADDGIVCVNMIEKKDADYYNLVLMDIQMPNMDGYKATQLIRQFSDKKKSRIPVIAMTANAFEEDRRNAIAAGMNDHIAKPIHVEKLLLILKKFIGQQEEMVNGKSVSDNNLVSFGEKNDAQK